MENNNVVNTETSQPITRTSQKIGKHLRATHYKLGLDGKLFFLIISNIILNYYLYRMGPRK